ncbi:hypothetical protein TNCV_1812711 [Trichonephila clavipes]|uniref:Uncharacterized protein n=1 Tax=Trichonephila clavipes TaxID=2585209 RepID=A0A8X6W8F1_TRICX|nr:hypothetical protein TNCV_1812711 [Trichonephila clavipes]
MYLYVKALGSLEVRASDSRPEGLGSFTMQEKGGNRLVPDLDYMVDALKLPNQALGGSGESQQKCVVWRCSDGTHLFCWPILVNR